MHGGLRVAAGDDQAVRPEPVNVSSYDARFTVLAIARTFPEARVQLVFFVVCQLNASRSTLTGIRRTTRLRNAPVDDLAVVAEMGAAIAEFANVAG